MNSYVRNEVFKDRDGDYNVEIDAKIYFQHKEDYLLTSQLGPRWRTQPSNFTRGDEHDEKWKARIHTYCDKILDRMGLRRRDLQFLSFETEWHPWVDPYDLPDPRGDPRLDRDGSYRTFKIEMVTDVKVLARNRLPF